MLDLGQREAALIQPAKLALAVVAGGRNREHVGIGDLVQGGFEGDVALHLILALEQPQLVDDRKRRAPTVTEASIRAHDRVAAPPVPAGDRAAPGLKERTQLSLLEPDP